MPCSLTDNVKSAKEKCKWLRYLVDTNAQESEWSQT